MIAFKIGNTEYHSIKEFCKKNKISYWAFIRLCRKYKKASQDPSIAALHLLGIKKISGLEQKTFKYERDKELNRLRIIDFRARKDIKIRKNSVKFVYSID